MTDPNKSWPGAWIAALIFLPLIFLADAAHTVVAKIRALFR